MLAIHTITYHDPIEQLRLMAASLLARRSRSPGLGDNCAAPSSVPAGGGGTTELRSMTSAVGAGGDMSREEVREREGIAAVGSEDVLMSYSCVP